MEFLFDQDGTFYFMEMNTRIQVEHPVTEEVTGLDLVKEQIRVAAGENAVAQAGGHRVARARDRVPHQRRGLTSTASGRARARSRTGTSPAGRAFASTATSTPATPCRRYYDSMIGKLIAYGKSRDEALRRMEIALDEMIVEGIKTTIPFHRLALRHPRFQKGDLDTHFVEELLKPAGTPPAKEALTEDVAGETVRVGAGDGAPSGDGAAKAPRRRKRGG